ncbi:secreted protein [Melampsora americana]|nr:secreted protein [Melampsora americana]
MFVPWFCALLVSVPNMIKAEEDRKMSISLKYRWNEKDPHFSNMVTINWDRTGTCDHKVFKKNRDTCNPAVATLVPFEKKNEDCIVQVVDHLYNKGKRGKCTAKRNLQFRIDSPFKDNFFLIEIDNICCDHRCKITDTPKVICNAGPPGPVIAVNGQYIDECKNGN